MPEKQTATSEPYILFELAGAVYGIPSRQIQQLQMIERITPVPQAPPFVDGVAFHRGKVIPALNLRARFGFPRKAYDESARMIVVQSRERIVGLIVDTAREFVSLPGDAIQPPPEANSRDGVQYLSGVASLHDRLILVLNLEPILDSGVELKVDHTTIQSFPAAAAPAQTPAHTDKSDQKPAQSPAP